MAKRNTLPVPHLPLNRCTLGSRVGFTCASCAAWPVSMESCGMAGFERVGSA